jgi:hypothetical protein
MKYCWRWKPLQNQGKLYLFSVFIISLKTKDRGGKTIWWKICCYGLIDANCYFCLWIYLHLILALYCCYMLVIATGSQYNSWNVWSFVWIKYCEFLSKLYLWVEEKVCVIMLPWSFLAKVESNGFCGCNINR